MSTMFRARCASGSSVLATTFCEFLLPSVPQKKRPKVVGKAKNITANIVITNTPKDMP